MAIRVVNTFLRILLGALFIASAYLKLFPIEAFEYNFVSLGVANWTTAPVIARLLIALEFALGGLLLFNVWPRFTLYSVIGLLAFFTLYLVYQIVTQGNDGNCGCFGEYLEMTPFESIIKNAMMAGVAVWLLVTKAQWNVRKLPRWLHDHYTGVAIGLVTLALPFVLNPIQEPLQTDDPVGYRLPLENLYADTNPEKPSVDLREGKHVLALFSLRCPHCKTAALKMNTMKKRHPDMPFYFLLRGKTDTRLEPFLTATQHASVPYSVYNDDDFFRLSQGAVPAIYWLQNDTVVKSETLYSLNEDSILNWLNR